MYFEFPAINDDEFPPVSCGGREAEVAGKLAVMAGEGDEALSGGEVPEADVAVVGARGYQRQPLGMCYQPEIMGDDVLFSNV